MIHVYRGPLICFIIVLRLQKFLFISYAFCFVVAVDAVTDINCAAAVDDNDALITADPPSSNQRT